MRESQDRIPTLKERAEIIEQSTVSLDDKLTLAYLLLVPEKAGALFGTRHGVGDDPPTPEQEEEFTADFTSLRKTLKAAKIPFIVDEALGVQDGFYGYRVIAAKQRNNLATIRALINEEETEIVAASLGKLMGYPDSAIATYRSADAIEESDLPNDVRQMVDSKKLAPFIMFKLSRDHYNDELEKVGEWQGLIQANFPKLYDALVARYDQEAALESGDNAGKTS